MRNDELSWTVTGKNGTQSTYTLMGWTGEQKFRWGLTSRSDVLTNDGLGGNTVAYTWDCAGSTDHCYPDTITYNGTTITFYRETRPDPVSSPVQIVETERLKTIDVQVSGARARAYQLSYDESPSTGRSLLSAVQMYGTDAVLDVSGNVESGTSLPATSGRCQLR